MPSLTTGRAIVAGLLLLWTLGAPRAAEFDATFEELLPPDLWKAANHGRIPLRADGTFAFPESVRRVYVDVGAHKLKISKPVLKESDDVAVVAIEPLSELWPAWPDDPRLIAVPSAVSLDRGTLEFFVTERPQSSSLLKPNADHVIADRVQVREKRQIPSVRLEDILVRIPTALEIFFLKTDVQGMDLQVLKSAGKQLHRVERVDSEIINWDVYLKDGKESMSKDWEFHAYMKSMGFRLEKEVATPNRELVGALYVNERLEGAPNDEAP